MWNFIRAFVVCAFGALVASCDLQPKIVALPDTVGEFISSRYPTLLADPKTEPEIYNSAVSDYGVYASPDLYGTGAVDEYINYSAVDDYVLPEQVEETENAPQEPESIAEPETSASVEKVKVETEEVAPVETESDVLEIPDYEPDTLSVPARAAAGTVVVRHGDTLYAIAREHNMTVDEIAKINKLSAPYTIRVGQVLKIEKPKLVAEQKIEPNIETKPEPVVKEKTKETPKETVKEAPKEKPEVRVPVKTIKIEKGDTLYSISRAYAVPVNDLAVMNNLSAPFALRVGDSLKVPDLVERVSAKKDITQKAEPVKAQSKIEAKPEQQAKPKAKTETKSQQKPQVKTESKTGEKSTQKSAKKTNQKKVTETKKTVDKKVPEKKVEMRKTETKKIAPVKTETPKIVARSSSKFSWPVRGKILSAFGAKTGGLYNDGINISAAFDSMVVAAENGVVAYAGNEVRGMGNLVIIQHSDGWMTVYAHLNSMSVRRGARVSVGNKIGTVGQTGKVTSPQLHFEIRKGTKAYNPINYLKK
ncbi:MAG: peptidoglycan DD-metalloendopeptidase family protein [Alphaproteobacteria bacterium]|nr:peptidoglycan DD-metalloendopeptidase family protein [Alphaproteobacteria bacterium]